MGDTTSEDELALIASLASAADPHAILNAVRDTLIALERNGQVTAADVDRILDALERKYIDNRSLSLLNAETRQLVLAAREERRRSS